MVLVGIYRATYLGQPYMTPSQTQTFILVIPFLSIFFQLKMVLREWRFGFEQSCTLLFNPKHSYTLEHSYRILYQTLILLIPYLTHNNFTNLYHPIRPFWSILKLKRTTSLPISTKKYCSMSRLGNSTSKRNCTILINKLITPHWDVKSE